MLRLRFAIPISLLLLTTFKISEGSQLRSTTVATTITRKVQQQQEKDQEQKEEQQQIHHHRKLKYKPMIVGYVPSTIVTDHNQMDKDVYHINEALKVGNFEDAYDIYKYGSYSKPVATLTLLEPLSINLIKNTYIEGTNNDNTIAKGFLYETYIAGSETIRIQYKDDITHSINCNIGGNPKPIINGCFQESGTIIVNGTDDNGQQQQSQQQTTLIIDYLYSIYHDNHHERTLQKFTLEAYKNMYECEFCPYNDYENFYNYYNKKGSYADIIIKAALEGKVASFRTDNNDNDDNDNDGVVAIADIDFTKTIGSSSNSNNNIGRYEAFRKTLIQLIMFMEIINQMENAIDNCYKIKCDDTDDNTNCLNDSIIYSWDQGVAYYSGSREGRNGSGHGVMLYAHADQLCTKMNTCSNGIGQHQIVSNVNIEIIQQFTLGHDLLQKQQCLDVAIIKNRIVQLMIIPNIQDTLYYAFQLSQFNDVDDVDVDVDDEEQHARTIGNGAIAAASILPYIYACNETDAEIIYSNMKYDNTTGGITDFDLVKTVLERNYDCLGIKCTDIGGIINLATNEYYNNTIPCNYDPNTTPLPPPPSKPTTTTTNTDTKNNNEEEEILKEENNNDTKQKNNRAGKVLGTIFIMGLIVTALIVLPNFLSSKQKQQQQQSVETERNTKGEFS